MSGGGLGATQRKVELLNRNSRLYPGVGVETESRDDPLGMASVDNSTKRRKTAGREGKVLKNRTKKKKTKLL